MKHVNHSKWNDFLYYTINFIKELFHFKGENLRLTDASFANMQFPNNTGFDKGKLSVMAFLNNLLVT